MRSTLAGALVVIDKLRTHVPLTDELVFTSNGQLIGGRGQALFSLLKKEGIPENYLRDGVTTRSTDKFRRLLTNIEYGRRLKKLSKDERLATIDQMTGLVKQQIKGWFARQHLKIACDTRLSPQQWIDEIFRVSRERSAGRVEQHLVGAKLEKRFPNVNIGRDAANAGDVQTSRAGDFYVGRTAYHITAAPSVSVIHRCKENVRDGKYPVLLVPRNAVERAKGLAEAQGMETQISVFSIEDYLAQNIVELALDEGVELIVTMRAIIAVYNDRIQQAETDKSLRIELF